MGELREFSLAVRVFLRAYRWRRIDPVPWTPLPKPLAPCRLALGTGAGFVLPGQPPFDKSMRGGDWSYREIPGETRVEALNEFQRSEAFDHDGIRQDPNLGLPLDRARELVQRGRIGSVAPRHLSFMGSISAPGRLIRQSAPQAAQRLVADKVDVALLVPV